MFLLLLQAVVADIFKPITTDDAFKAITLDNGLVATIISCEDCSESGVAMGVKTGSIYDTVPGIAHFLEHMLFFESKTYPQEDYWMTYIDTHGGYTNAFTEYEATVYFYSISNEALEKSMHIFSRAFAEPIFLEETASREVLSVESEMQGSKYSDDWRVQKFLEVLIGSPLDHMTTGDLNALSDPSIIDELYSFWDQYYRADNMKLCIYGNFTLDQLEFWVREMYSDIKNGTEFTPLKIGSGQGNYIEGTKVDPGKIVTMMWKIDPEDAENDLATFVGYLIQYELSTTLSKIYSNSQFYSGVFTELSTFTVFIMEAILPSSDISTDAICGYFLSAGEALKSMSNETLYALWEDYRLSNYYKFYYSDPMSSADLVSTIAYNMLFYEEYYYFAGSDTKKKYSYSVIQSLLEHLSSESALVGVLTDNPQQPLPIYDAEFDMDYMVTNKTYSQIDITYTQLEQNPYIPKDLKLVMTKFTEELIMTENSTHRVWFKYNTSLKKPIAIISSLIFIKDWQDYKVISNIHCNIVLTIARNKLAYYSMAGYGAEITVESPGIVIKVTGWNEGIYNYLEEILKIFTTSDSSYFSSMKDSYDYTLKYQEDQESYEKAINFLSRLITPYFTSLSEQYTKLQNLTEVDYTYLLYALPYCSLDVLVLGNLNVPGEILDIFDRYFVATESEKQYRHSLGIEGYNIFTAPTQVENAIFNWYEFGFYDPKTYVTLQLLDVQTSDLAYRMLRSQAQLGYTVSMSSYDGFLTNGLYLVVQGDKYNPQEMQEYIDMFWVNVSISETEFEEIKQTMKSTTVPSTTYEDMYEDIWYEITTGRLGFFEMTEWLEEIDEVSLEDIKSFIGRIIEHENELSIRMYVDMSEATEKSISIDYYRDSNKD